MQYAYNVPDYFGTFLNFFQPFSNTLQIKRSWKKIKDDRMKKKKKKICKNNMN